MQPANRCAQCQTERNGRGNLIYTGDTMVAKHPQLTS